MVVVVGVMPGPGAAVRPSLRRVMGPVVSGGGYGPMSVVAIPSATMPIGVVVPRPSLVVISGPGVAVIVGV